MEIPCKVRHQVTQKHHVIIHVEEVTDPAMASQSVVVLVASKLGLERSMVQGSHCIAPAHTRPGRVKCTVPRVVLIYQVSRLNLVQQKVEDWLTVNSVVVCVG